MSLMLPYQTLKASYVIKINGEQFQKLMGAHPLHNCRFLPHSLYSVFENTHKNLI